MPSFKGQVSEEEIVELIAFIKALRRGQTPRRVEELSAAGRHAAHHAAEGEAVSIAVLEPRDLSEPPEEPRETYLNASTGVLSWLLTKDHKRIALLYLVTVTAMFFIGGFAITIVRLNLMTPRGGLVTADTYNRLFTTHGVIMVFFFLVPVVPTVLGNFCVPLMIGAKDLAFPRINLASWYLFVLGAGWTLFAMLAGGVDTGWTFYTPYSTRSSHYNVIPTMIGVVIAGFSSIFTGLNFIVTIHKMRAPA